MQKHCNIVDIFLHLRTLVQQSGEQCKGGVCRYTQCSLVALLDSPNDLACRRGAIAIASSSASSCCVVNLTTYVGVIVFKRLQNMLFEAAQWLCLTHFLGIHSRNQTTQFQNISCAVKNLQNHKNETYIPRKFSS